MVCVCVCVCVRRRRGPGLQGHGAGDVCGESEGAESDQRAHPVVGAAAE